MKFIVDECVGPFVANWLKQNGYDVISIHDDLPGIDDELIIDKAIKEGRIIITSDKDFGDIVFKDKKDHNGIVLLRLVDERPHNKIAVLKEVLNYKNDLYCNFVVATERTTRLIRLKQEEIA